MNNFNSISHVISNELNVNDVNSKNTIEYKMNDFEEYIRQGEPDKQQKAYAWRTAIGLQAVDGLQPSEYLKETARKHIEGEIDIDEAQKLIKSYYQSKTSRTAVDDSLEEADTVSSHIAKILGE